MYVVKNYMEDAVDRFLRKMLLSIQEVCNDDYCFAEIKAITLNMLPSKYIVVSEDDINNRLDSLTKQFDMDIIRAITQAIEEIKTRDH